MRLKNKTSIALSIANGYHWKTPFQLEKEKNKKSATELPTLFNRTSQSQKSYITDVIECTPAPSQRMVPDDIGPCIC